MSSCKSHKLHCYLANLIMNSLFGTYIDTPFTNNKKRWWSSLLWYLKQILGKFQVSLLVLQFQEYESVSCFTIIGIRYEIKDKREPSLRHIWVSIPFLHSWLEHMNMNPLSLFMAWTYIDFLHQNDGDRHMVFKH
jgi:hypothetical protein